MGTFHDLMITVTLRVLSTAAAGCNCVRLLSASRKKLLLQDKKLSASTKKFITLKNAGSGLCVTDAAAA
jgi:hypothetical protein